MSLRRRRDKPRRKRPELFPNLVPRVKYRKRPRDTPRMLWTKTLRCCAHRVLEFVKIIEIEPGVSLYGPCKGAVEADHAGWAGIGRKGADRTCIPLCERHHRSPGLRHLLHGKVARGWLRPFLDAMAAHYDEIYEQHLLRAAA